jgi:Uma2 family endonuclease
MGTITKISFEEFQKLQEAADENVRYELDEGELILTPSPSPLHDLVCFRLRSALADFVETNNLGVVVGDLDFRLSANTIRQPDVAFIAKDHMAGFDLHRVPIEGAPTLAAEVISPRNYAQDVAKKVRQYLAGGTQAVWVLYPLLKAVEIHDQQGSRRVSVNDRFAETEPFSGLEFAISLKDLFDENPARSTLPRIKPH